jgi:4'-phosphopantetheinyl transferase
VGGALSPPGDGLSTAAVVVWRASLGPPPDIHRRAAEWLGDDERQRASRFLSERDRDRFVAARGFLRAVLARCTGLDPRDVRFAYGPLGKPALEPAPAGLRFSLAHADDVAVCAVASGCGEVGIDVERVRPLADIAAVASRALSAHEAALWWSLAEGLRLRAFFEAWTRKEAVLKALGCGLGHLDAVDVTFAPREPARIVNLSPSLGAIAQRMSLHAFELEPGLVGAVVTTGGCRAVRHLLWEWA